MHSSEPEEGLRLEEYLLVEASDYANLVTGIDFQPIDHTDIDQSTH